MSLRKYVTWLNSKYISESYYNCKINIQQNEFLSIELFMSTRVNYTSTFNFVITDGWLTSLFILLISSVQTTTNISQAKEVSEMSTT